MKYIRTKDGIYESDYDMVLMSMPPKYAARVNGEVEYIPEREVIKRSNDLEELFGLIVVFKGNGIRRYMDYGMWKKLEKAFSLDDDIYGAVFKGDDLAFVSKRSKEGAWELL